TYLFNDTAMILFRKAFEVDYGDGQDQINNCNYGEYMSPITGLCTQINPITKAELLDGIWLDVAIDMDATPPQPIMGEYNACHEFSQGLYDYDLNLIDYKKDENGQTKIDSLDNVTYDESTGMLSMSFPSDINEGGTEADMHNEIIYLTKESGKVFVLRYEPYNGSFMIDGMVDNNTTATCSAVADSLVFRNDYFNPNTNKAIQVTGHIYLPDNIDTHRVSVQAITQNWNWVSQSDLDTVNNNAYTLGFDESSEVAIQVGYDSFETSERVEYYLLADGNWTKRDYSKNVSEYVITIDQNMSDMDLNVSAIFASQVKFSGSIAYESGTTVNIEMIDLQSGNYFGRKELNNDDHNFSIALPSTEIGDKYIV
ncbi:MAG: hypothetical protein KAJ49_08410, partial [Arcobacteraceae bacterium]|nr:hypothetical protein [Arcobacteraceae bacterium]